MERTLKGFPKLSEDKKTAASIVVRAPTLEEVTALLRARIDAEASRKFVAALLVSHTLAEIEAVYPMAATVLSGRLIALFGIGESLQCIPQEELDGEIAKAFVEAEKAGFGGLSVFQATPDGAKEPMHFILRAPRSHEVRARQKDALSVHTAKTLISAICVHGDLKSVDQQYPGLYYSLAAARAEQDGLDEELTLDLA